MFYIRVLWVKVSRCSTAAFSKSCTCFSRPKLKLSLYSSTIVTLRGVTMGHGPLNHLAAACQLKQYCSNWYINCSCVVKYFLVVPLRFGWGQYVISLANFESGWNCSLCNKPYFSLSFNGRTTYKLKMRMWLWFLVWCTLCSEIHPTPLLGARDMWGGHGSNFKTVLADVCIQSPCLG